MQNNKYLNEVISKVANKHGIKPYVVEAVLLSEFKTIKIAMENSKKNIKIPFIAKFVTSDARIAWIDDLKAKSTLSKGTKNKKDE